MGSGVIQGRVGIQGSSPCFHEVDLPRSFTWVWALPTPLDQDRAWHMMAGWKYLGYNLLEHLVRTSQTPQPPRHTHTCTHTHAHTCMHVRTHTHTWDTHCTAPGTIPPGGGHKAIATFMELQGNYREHHRTNHTPVTPLHKPSVSHTFHPEWGTGRHTHTISP